MMEKSGTLPQEPEDRIASPMDGLAQALFDMASVLYGEYQDSARLFAQMSLYLNPNLNDSRILLGHMAARVERYDEAIAFYQQIDPRDDKELEIKLQRQVAELLEQSDRSEQAITVLKKLVDKTGSLEAQIQLGDSYRHIEDYSKALTAYNKAYEMLGNQVPQEHWSLIYARGMTNERLHNWEQAEKDLKAALAFEPDHPYILNYLGYSWADQGINLDKAAEMIARAVRLRPTDGSIVDSLGWVYYRMGKYTEAVATLEGAVELLPYDPTVNDHLGDAYWQVGRKTEARFQWTRALSFSKEEDLSKAIQDKLDKGLADTAEGKSPNNAQKQAQNKTPDKTPVSP
jgi:tetratricopeptide (TPR) repeat protein